MHQHKSNWADGVAWVTQCPIEPGHSFLYEFEVTDQVCLRVQELFACEGNDVVADDNDLLGSIGGNFLVSFAYWRSVLRWTERPADHLRPGRPSEEVLRC